MDKWGEKTIPIIPILEVMNLNKWMLRKDIKAIRVILIQGLI